MATKINLTSEEKETLRLENEKIHFPSRFSFVHMYGGWRPGKIHTFLGRPSGGKSTLMRSILADLEDKDARVFLWLSEESVQEFETSLAYTSINMDNLYVFSEKDNAGSFADYDKGIRRFKEEIRDVQPDIVIFDNLTTSPLYSQKFSRQNQCLTDVDKYCNDLQIPFILFIHTSSQIRSNANYFIDQNEIRGSRDIVNISQFYYVMQNVQLGDDIRNTVRVTKYRNRPAKDHFFVLNYDEKSLTYKGDGRRNFEQFKLLLFGGVE